MARGAVSWLLCCASIVAGLFAISGLLGSHGTRVLGAIGWVIVCGFALVALVREFDR